MTTNELSCGNCGVGYESDDIFCENCGYDFITGSLPSGDESGLAGMPSLTPTPPLSPDAAAAVGGEAGTGGEAGLGTSNGSGTGTGTLAFEIIVDRSYFDEVVAEGELEFPDPIPSVCHRELSGSEFHVGRTSQSRAIHPDLDISELTGDPAVSSRHAVIRVEPDGTVTITDVGSTNGTFVAKVDGDAIKTGDPVPVPPGAPVYVGAWTKLVISSEAG